MWHQKYIGIPFLAGGSDLHGTDCWHLVRMIYADQMGVHLPAFPSDAELIGRNDGLLGELIESYKNAMNEFVKVESVRPLDVLHFMSGGNPTHFAIAIDSRLMLHIRMNQDSVVERYDISPWANRFLGAYRYDG